jgi:hypothetical protein
MGSTAELNALRDAALWLLPRTWLPAETTVHYMHVIAGGLRPWERRQRSLFEDRREKDDRIESVQHEINAAVGRFALRSAATLPLADVYGDLASNYDICDIYGKSCF